MVVATAPSAKNMMTQVISRQGAQRVAALLSGGVDSTVAAGLLREQGHDVIGVHLLLGCSSGGGCGGADSVAAARRAAAEVKIPFQVIDFRESFSRFVIKPFLRGRIVGRTRNPCVSCNAQLRFGLVWERLRPLGVEVLATGHYARLLGDRPPVLARASDPSSDQSYVLYAIPDRQLARCLFPLGAMSKDEVRREAARRGYSCAERRSSQDLCFATGSSIAELVERERAAQHRLHSGDIVDRSGLCYGRHDGVHHFTVGQRGGLGSLGGQRRYVVEIEARAGRVIVGSQEESHRCRFRVGRVTLHRDGREPFRAMVATRYRTKLARAVIVPRPSRRAWVFVEAPGVIAAPGQSAVWYDGDRVIGGGEIV